MESHHSTAALNATVRADLDYLENAEGLKAITVSVGGGAVPERPGNYTPHRVAIHNARARSGPFDLDREGFRLLPHQSAVRDFYDDAEIAGVYEAEVKALLCQALGARRVEVFDHTRRSSSPEVRKARQIREPAATIHNDYTAKSGLQRLRDHFADDPETLATLIKERFAIVNVWRSIRGSVRRSPMAFCDARTIAPQDLVSVTRKAKERIGEIQMALFNPAHDWYSFPQMTMDEALIFKTYDSAEDGRTRCTLHTAFEDPATPADAPPRESLETRCFVFF